MRKSKPPTGNFPSPLLQEEEECYRFAINCVPPKSEAPLMEPK
jgi:hypothetical protein